MSKPLNWFRVVVSDSRGSLLEIDVDSDGLDKVKRVLFVERQAELTFCVKLWSLEVFLHRYGVVLAWADLNIWVTRLQFCWKLESV
jgi:hypothetical protein